MKRSLFFLLILLLLFGIFVFQRGGPDQFVIHRGVNVSMWLSQVYDDEPLRIRLFNELDAIFLKSVGFDHIRLPLDEERLWNEDGTRNPKTWKEMHQAIQWCDQHGLRVIADLHIVRSHHFNAEFDGGKNTLFTDPEAQVHFLNLWKQLAQELYMYPNRLLAYEILNEAEASNLRRLESAGEQCRGTNPGFRAGAHHRDWFEQLADSGNLPRVEGAGKRSELDSEFSSLFAAFGHALPRKLGADGFV